MKNRTIPYEQMGDEQLQDILLRHNCSKSPGDNCDCEIVEEILSRREMSRDLNRRFPGGQIPEGAF